MLRRTATPEFRALFDQHLEFVWRWLGHMGVREADVLDLAQKVFLTAYLKLGEFEGPSHMKSWLFAICRRVASDYRRTARFRREIATEAEAFDLYIDTHEDAQKSAESRERRQQADAILNRLPEAQRLVFVLFELEEMNGQDIAQLVGVSVGTVRSRLRLARQAFSREAKRLRQGSAQKQAG